MKKLLVTLFAAALVVGCFPIMLDVSKEGDLLFSRAEGLFCYNIKTEKVSAVYLPGKGMVIPWSRWAPDGKSVMFVEKKGGGGGGMMMGSSGEAVYTISKDGKNKKELYKPSSPLAYARFVPGTKLLSVGEAVQSQKLKTAVPTLKLIDTGTKEVRELVKEICQIYDVSDDGKFAVAMKIDKKAKKGNNLAGRWR